jgi:hypothetical protein|tara:strand:+ start:226 stop:477 length:252 start_codon:yes stop_codon:yes gene_type:complete
MKKIDNRTTGDKLIDSLKVETEVIGFSQNQLTLYIAQAEELIKKLAFDLDRHREAYEILYEYFDSIPDDEKVEVDKKLMKLDL